MFRIIHDSLRVEPYNSRNNGIYIGLVRDEPQKVGQLLEGANARLCNRKRSDRAHGESYRTKRNQTRGMELDGSDNPCDNLNAPVGIHLLQGAIVQNSTRALENAPVHLRKEGECNQDLSNMAPL